MLKIQTSKTRHKIQREMLREAFPSGKQAVFTVIDEGFLLPVSIAQGALFAPLARWAHSHPASSIDIAITHTLQKMNSPLLQRIALAFSIVNSPAVMNALTFPLAYLLWKKRLYLEAEMIVGGTVVANLLRLSFREIVDRPRPDPALVHVEKPSHHPSFPSGHVLASVGFWGWIFALSPLLTKGRPREQEALRGLAVLCTALIGLSRVYLGKHWASDVLGGSWLAGSLRLYLRLRRSPLTLWWRRLLH
jgi:membrane-associated phospholipid phosphatase